MLLATKLSVPPARPRALPRPRLIERLNQGLHRKLTLISAPAGFGKTTLLATWIAERVQGAGGSLRPVSGQGTRDASERRALVSKSSSLFHPASFAWLSLDEADNDPAQVLGYLVAALQTAEPTIGAGLIGALQSPQPPPLDAIVAALLQDLAAAPGPLVLIIDDYHMIQSPAVHQALRLLVERMPPQHHLVIAGREDPPLPLARLRARDQLTELRAADLRFTQAEAADFLGQVMDLRLSAGAVAALEERTEGWAAGLQLAALSLQGHADQADLLAAFGGGHRFVFDYLMEEVLRRQPPHIQAFLLRTAILDRMCGPLCDALSRDEGGGMRDEPHLETSKSIEQFILHPSSFILQELERANLFLVPLDAERRWYRYHHLFAEMLRRQLDHDAAEAGAPALHRRASAWFEGQGLIVEAFRHAAAAGDVERAERLIESGGMPLHIRGVVSAVLGWLGALPAAARDARPSLWWRHAGLLLMSGQTLGVEEKLQAAEAGLGRIAAPDQQRLLAGRIAAARATLALTRYDTAAMLDESRRALEHLPPAYRSLRANAHWTLGYAHFLQGDRAPARRAYADSIALSRAAGDIFTAILATIGLGRVQEADNQLHEAAATYRHAIELAGEHPLQIIGEAHIGLARVHYEWDDLEAAERHGRRGLHFAQQYERVIDRYVICEVVLARIRLAQGNSAGAAALLAQAALSARQNGFTLRLPEVAAEQVRALLDEGKLGAAAQLAAAHELPLSRARVRLAEGDPAAALAILDPLRRQAEARGWADELLRALALQALAHEAQGAHGRAERLLGEALALAEPGGLVRLFIDEGRPLARILTRMTTEGGSMRAYRQSLLAALGMQEPVQASSVNPPPSYEPLSERELAVLRLIAQGLSNDEIGDRLALALSTVKGYNRTIFGKLQAQRRTEAVARARELGIL